MPVVLSTWWRFAYLSVRSCENHDNGRENGVIVNKRYPCYLQPRKRCFGEKESDACIVSELGLLFPALNLQHACIATVLEFDSTYALVEKKI